VRSSSAELISSLVSRLPAANVTTLMYDMIGLDTSCSSPGLAPVAGQLLGCGAALRSAGDRGVDCRSAAFSHIAAALEDGRGPVVVAACSALALAASPPAKVEALVPVHEALCREIVAEFCPPLLHLLTKSDALEIRRAAVSTIKEFAKYHPEHVVHLAGRIAATLQGILSANDINIRLKRQAERAMKYILGITFHGTLDGPIYLAAMESIQAASPDTARFMRDYAKRMLSKLSEESDDNW
ncbi:unnamed protein product, partial [Symbiodinium microadriaticum]